MAEPSEILRHAHVGQKELLDGGDTTASNTQRSGCLILRMQLFILSVVHSLPCQQVLIT
ncbi:hypothetical protein NC651_027318 [Populus alba x Populus x berolinensis]|nr:hypothetical protein NC651_027318 [Populus alba x Populus x berolinensis]